LELGALDVASLLFLGPALLFESLLCCLGFALCTPSLPERAGSQPTSLPRQRQRPVPARTR
jgi:hypothetical protein